MRLVVATLLALVTGVAHAQAPDVVTPDGGGGPPPEGTTRNADERVIVMGQPLAFVPFELPATFICDDLSVLSVVDEGNFLRLTGLKPGATACSVSSLRAPGRRFVYRFIVVP